MVRTKVSTIIASLRQRMCSHPQRHHLLDCPIEINSDPMKSWAAVSSVAASVQTELQETKHRATTILESLVRRSEAERRRLEVVFDDLEDPILIVDDAGSILAANQATRKLLSLTTAELVGATLNTFLPACPTDATFETETLSYLTFLEPIADDEVKDYRAYCTDYVRTQPTFLAKPVECKYTRSDGVELTLSVTINILTPRPCEEFNYVVTIRDQTDRARIESELNHLRVVSSSLASCIGVPMFYKDSDLRFTTVNRPLLNLLGLREQDVVGKDAHGVFSQPSADQFHELNRQVLESQSEGMQSSVDLRTLNGMLCTANVASRVLKSGTDVAGVQGILTSELDIDNNPSLRALIVESLTKAVVFVDKAQTIAGCSDEFLRLLGREKSDIIGLPTADDALRPLFDKAADQSVIADVVEFRNRKINRTRITIKHHDAESTIYVFFAQE